MSGLPVQYSGSTYPNPYSNTPMPQLEQMRESGQLINTSVTPTQNGVRTNTLQEVELTSQSNQGQSYQTRTLLDTQPNEMYDPEDLPMDVMQDLIQSGQLVGVGYAQQMRSYCEYHNGQPACRRYQETIVSGVGPNGVVYRARTM